MMRIDRLILGDFQTNCYVVRRDVETRDLTSLLDCVIVDAGIDAQGLVAFLDDHQLRPAALILTHGHIDHIEGLSLLRPRFPGVKVYVHTLDASMLADPMANLSGMLAVTS